MPAEGPLWLALRREEVGALGAVGGWWEGEGREAASCNHQSLCVHMQSAQLAPPVRGGDVCSYLLTSLPLLLYILKLQASCGLIHTTDRKLFI